MRNSSTLNSLSLILFILLSFLFVAGCGYKPFPRLREDIRKIYVPTFKNSTWHPGVSGEITDALRREIILDGTFVIVDKDEADAMLSGEVIGFEHLSLIYDEEKNIIGGWLKIRIEAQLTSLLDEEILWQGKIEESGSIDRFFADVLARREKNIIEFVAEKIARRIVERITEG